MQMQKILFVVLATVSLSGIPVLVQAADDAPPPRQGKDFCRENPGKCEEARARREEFCKGNPEKCEQMKNKRAERREFCKANPEKCKEQREQIQAKKAQMQAKCKADPAKCDEMKEEARKKFQDWMEAPPSPPSGPPPAK